MISITKDGILGFLGLWILRVFGVECIVFQPLILHSLMLCNLATLKSSVFLQQTKLPHASGHLLIPFPLSEIVFFPTVLGTPPGSPLSSFLFRNQLKDLYLVISSMTYNHPYQSLLSSEQSLNRPCLKQNSTLLK